MTPTRRPFCQLAAVLAALTLAPACGDDSGIDPTDGTLPGDLDAGVGQDAYLDGGIWFCGPAACECNDGIDNDGDGFIDLQDPACISPSDGSESVNFTPGSTQCSNLADDDADSMIDSADPECTGAL